MKYLKTIVLGAFLIILLTNCSRNSAPTTPSVTSGLSRKGITYFTYTFKASTTDPNGDDISYQFLWGDIHYSPWSNYIPSGDTISMDRYYFDPGTYQVRVRAQDEKDGISEWSAAHIITIGWETSVVDTISVTSSTASIVADPNGEYIYTVNPVSGDIEIIKILDKTIQTISVGNSPRRITPLPDGTYLYVMSYGDNAVITVRTSDNSVGDTISAVPSPVSAAALPNGEYIYVASEGMNNIYIIRTSDNSLFDSVAVSSPANDIVALPNGEYIYAAISNDSVSVIRTSDNTNVGGINVGNGTLYLAALPNSQYVYVSSELTDKLYAIQTSDNTLVDSASVGISPRRIAADPLGEVVYVPNYSSNNVFAVRTTDNDTVGTIAGSHPMEVAPLPNGQYIYILGNGDNVYEVDLNRQ